MIFIDMDGVLADFHKGVLNKLRMELHEFKDKIKPGDFWWDNILGLNTDFFDYDFWIGLEKTTEADDIIRLCIEKGGHDICLLSTPMHNKRCIEGKLDWIEKHYPAIPHWIGRHKHYCSGSGKILIDDYDDNIRRWHIKGGRGILVPRYWNEKHDYEGNIVEYIGNMLAEII